VQTSHRVALLVALAALLGSTTAHAVIPADFKRPQVYVHPTFQVSQFIGALSDATGTGVGMAVTQGMQFGYWGVNLTIDTHFFLTDQEAPPFNNSLQIAGARLAGRFVYPFDATRVFGELSVRRIGFISNTLGDITGPELNFHSVGLGVGLRFLQLAPLYFETRASYDLVFDLADTSMLTFDFAIGVRSVL
jgi:hypothetical protein